LTPPVNLLSRAAKRGFSAFAMVVPDGLAQRIGRCDQRQTREAERTYELFSRP